MKNTNPLLLTVLVLLLVLTSVQAAPAAWTLRLKAHPNGPEKFIAIDKKDQTMFIFEQHSPLKLYRKYPCTTGKSDGDKLKEGDLRTPEGVYFIEHRLTEGLDHELYGDLAFTLNFPNPIDRIRGKGGHGIWIHGRGQSIVPRDTRGCVAMNTPDLKKLQDLLMTQGMPVIIADKVQWDPNKVEESEEAQAVSSEIRGWAQAWSSRSAKFFEYYDQPRYAMAEGQPFSKFRTHKERLFQDLPWIKVDISNLKIIPGPDYYVAWFVQSYRTPNLNSQGVKRVYMMQDQAGKWRIVGEEFKSGTVGVEKEPFSEGINTLIAAWLDDWRKAWEAGDLDGYLAFYSQAATQDSRRGIDAISDQKRGVWETKGKPRSVVLGAPQVKLSPQGIIVTFEQKYVGADGYADRGRKTLQLEPRGDVWVIVDEQWSPM